MTTNGKEPEEGERRDTGAQRGLNCRLVYLVFLSLHLAPELAFPSEDEATPCVTGLGASSVEAISVVDSIS